MDLDLVLAAWNVEAAVAVVTPGGVIGEAGRVDAVRPWASVTKLLTALAVLVAWEEGTLGLDDPAGPPGATIRHLLAHASGLSPAGDTVLAPPGDRRIYSNGGFEQLGAALEEAAGMPFAEYLKAGVLAPLGMDRTRLVGTPAAGAEGPLGDLALLAAELLSPTLVSAGTLAEATTVAWPGLNGVLPGFGTQRPNDWGLGFELRDHKRPHWTGAHNSPATFGHFGQSGSFLWIDPGAGVGCVELAAKPFGRWSIEAWPALADTVLASV